MNRIKINNTDLAVSRINLGGNVFGWTLDESASFKLLDAFAEGGFNFVDTADTYPWWINGKGGLSEEIIGKWLKQRGNRQQLVIATKVGSETKEHGYDISRKHIFKSVDESLRRLQTDYIDLYYTHFDDQVTPVAETLAAYDELIKAGKIRYIAASNVSPARLAESFEVAEKNHFARYVALQPHYNLLERAGYEGDYLPFVEQYGLTVFPYWSLAAGFLTGKYRKEEDLAKSPRGAGVRKYLNEKGFSVLNALDTIAANHQAQPASVALAWLLAQPSVGAAIASATNETQLTTLFAATSLVLHEDELTLLEEVSR